MRTLLKVDICDAANPSRLKSIAMRAAWAQKDGREVVIYGAGLDFQDTRERLAAEIVKCGGEPTMGNPEDAS